MNKRKDLYPDAQKIIPWRIPEAFGKSIFIEAYVDANHDRKIIIRARILELSYMSIMHPPFVIVRVRINLNLQVLGQSLLYLKLRHRLLSILDIS